MVFGRDYSRRACRSQEKPELESTTVWAKGGIYGAGEKGLGKVIKKTRTNAAKVENLVFGDRSNIGR